MLGKSMIGAGLIAMMGAGTVLTVSGAVLAERPPAKIGGPKSSASAPPLLISEEDLDMGDVLPRSNVTRTVRLRNLGEETVVITSTSGDCSCTALITDGYLVIKPGDDAEMQIAIETRDMGVQTKKVRVHCEGFARPYEAIVKTNVTDGVEINPGGVKALIQSVGLLTLESVDGAAFRVLSLHGQAPEFVGFDPEKDEPVARYRLVYDLSKLEAEEFPAVVVIETDHPDAPFVAVRNFAKTTDAAAPPAPNAWRADYDFEFVGPLMPGESAEVEMRIAKAGRISREQTLTVSSDNEVLKAEIAGVDLDSNPKWMIVKVRVTASPQGEGFQAATLEFKLGGDRSCQVELFTRIIGG